MALPLIAGMLLKGVASNVIGGALGGDKQGGAQDPISSIFNSVLGGGDQQQQDQGADLLGGLLKGALNILG